MSINDGFLYSGINSQSINKSVRQRVKEQKDENKLKLTPAAEVVMEQIDKEKSRMGELLANLVTSDMTPEQVAQHLEAVKLHRLWLMDFEAVMKKTLRKARKKKVKEDADI